MARFSLITCGTLALLGMAGMAWTQTTAPTVRPLSGQRQVAPSLPVQQPPPAQPQPGAIAAPATSTVARPAQPAQPAPTTPAVPPVVTFRDGLLTVQALNSNLSSVITAIRNKTGIEFEGAENIAERVAISLGPLPEGEVLSAIFGGSKYNFVAIGRPDSPAIVQRVILTVKNQPGGATEAQAQPRPKQEGDEEDVPDETVTTPGGDPQDVPVQPPPVPQPQAETPPQQQPKTPEQLLQELQEMRRQKNSPEDPTQNPNPAPRKMPPQR